MLAFYTASTSSSISTLIRTESVDPQRMKVVDLVVIFDLIGGRPRNSKRIKSYARFTKGRRSRKRGGADRARPSAERAGAPVAGAERAQNGSESRGSAPGRE